MREIKFRGYKQKHFGCENCLGDLHEGCTELCKHKVGTMVYDCNHKLPKGWVVMQFTGLYDKNGKEIYEGDVVMFKETEEGTAGIGQVKWDVTEARFFVHTETEKTNLWQGFECFIDEGEVLDGDTDVYDMRVIGNIYENPELLDKLSSK